MLAGTWFGEMTRGYWDEVTAVVVAIVLVLVTRWVFLRRGRQQGRRAEAIDTAGGWDHLHQQAVKNGGHITEEDVEVAFHPARRAEMDQKMREG